MPVLKTRWRKVMRDLWDNKSRTALIVGSIAIGVFAFGGLLSAQENAVRDYNNTYLSSNPASAEFRVSEFDADLVDAVRGLRGVGAAEGRTQISLNLKQSDTQSVRTVVLVIPEYDEVTINTLIREGNPWPPARETIAIEQTSAQTYNLEVGDVIEFELSDGELKNMVVGSIVHDINILPSTISQTAYGYISEETLEWLEYDDAYTNLYITAAENRTDAEHIEQLAQEVEDRIELFGYTVLSTDVPDNPGESPAAFVLNAILLLLVVIGSFALVLSGFLILNTINALLAQQIKQIGMMKSVGARSVQIAAIYFVLVSSYGLMALIVAVPLGAVFGRLITGLMASIFNFNIMGYRTPLLIIVVQVLIALLTPLLASLIPITRGVQISVREAIYQSDSGKQGGSSLIDKLISRVKGLPRPMMLSLRNTFRKQARLVLTLVTLSLAGAMFIAVLGVRSQFTSQVEEEIAAYNLDVLIEFGDRYRAERLAREAQRLPQVEGTETWLTGGGTRVYDDNTEGTDINLIAVPPESEYFRRSADQGRWLQEGDGQVVVLTSDFLQQESDLELGDTLTLNIDGQDVDWEIVGIVDALGGPQNGSAYVPYEALARAQDELGFANALAIKTTDHSETTLQFVAQSLNDSLKDRNIIVANAQTISELADSLRGGPTVLTDLMLFMVALIAVVGGFGLAGTMSLNVLERTREIGVLRSVGASNSSVLGVILSEGLIIGLISAVIGIVLSLPVGTGLGTGIGLAFGGEPIEYSITVFAVGSWVLLALLIAAVSSFLPARRASKISVREALSYE